MAWTEEHRQNHKRGQQIRNISTRIVRLLKQEHPAYYQELYDKAIQQLKDEFEQKMKGLG